MTSHLRFRQRPWWKQAVDYVLDNWVTGVIATVVVAVLIGIAIFLGGWILSALLSILIIGLAITFGSASTLAGAIVIGVLLKLFGATIHELMSVWWTGPACDRFFAIVAATGYLELIASIFLIAYVVRFASSAVFGPIKLVSTSTTNNVKTGSDD